MGVGARRGMAVERGEEGSAVLLYAEAACPGFLERRLAAWLELCRGLRRLSMGAFPLFSILTPCSLELHTHLVFKRCPWDGGRLCGSLENQPR